MKTRLTQKQILDISRKTGMSFDFRMSKNGMMQYVEAALNGDNKKALDFAKAVVDANNRL